VRWARNRRSPLPPDREIAVTRDENAKSIERQPALRKFTKPLFCRRFGLFLEIWLKVR
jgi:hypothetical protein